MIEYEIVKTKKTPPPDRVTLRWGDLVSIPTEGCIHIGGTKYEISEVSKSFDLHGRGVTEIVAVLVKGGE